jgi:4-diphosphocytidyl-2-C-methyl-D-erythritol kinase
MPVRNLEAVVVNCPAKINLMLSIHGPRPDGYHELTSLVAQLTHGDKLEVRYVPFATTDTLVCDDPSVPVDPTNTVIAATQRFRAAHPFEGGFAYSLNKLTPCGAGLGGGSSNAAMALVSINRLLGSPLQTEQLKELAASVGSDCPLFFSDRAVLLRGRGETLEPIPEAASKALTGQLVLLFKPSFSISTPQAYTTMREALTYYEPAHLAQARLDAWLKAPQPIANWPLHNNMQAVAFTKYPALQVCLEYLRKQLGIRCLMSGSGSACFAFIEAQEQAESVVAYLRDCFGENLWWKLSRLR